MSANLCQIRPLPGRRLPSPVAESCHAPEMGYSERSMYRELSKLWDKLGASGRAAGLCLGNH